MDRLVSGLVASLGVLLAVLLLIDSDPFSAGFAVATTGLYAFLGWFSKPLPWAVAAVLGLPCFIGASMMCDISQGPVIEVLHPIHDKLWLISAYAFVRAIGTAITGAMSA